MEIPLPAPEMLSKFQILEFFPLVDGNFLLCDKKWALKLRGERLNIDSKLMNLNKYFR